MKLKAVFTLLHFIFVLSLTAQHQDVFPGLTGQELLDRLVEEYKSSIPLDQADARDTLFAVIDNHNDSLTCVYTGFTIWLDPALDPTQAAFVDDNYPDAINTEHTYPKSNGATGKAEGDMHHLFPARKDVNNDRGNYPFAEIPDDETEAWYYLDQTSSSIPVSMIDRYSEKRGFEFEPPEAHKGNVARAMFYFYTMYREQADMANADYFETQRNTLCQWHTADPADQSEWDRTWAIAGYQDGLPNPFVLDCTLAERTYCQDVAIACTPTATKEEKRPEPVFRLDRIMPNPVRSGAVFHYTTGLASHVTLDIFQTDGKKIHTLEIGDRTPGTHSLMWQKPESMEPGMVFCRLVFKTREGEYRAAGKMMVLP